MTIERLTAEELADLERREGKSLLVIKAEAKALRIIQAQEALIEDLEIMRVQDEAEIRQLRSGRFAPAERAVLDACAEMMLLPEEGRVRVPNQRDIDLVAEAEWAKRQEHQLADREEGMNIVGPPPQQGQRPVRLLPSRIQQLERYAAGLILDWESMDGLAPPDDMPEGVKALVNEYRGCSTGKCDQCGEPAILSPRDDDDDRRVCAWGCTGDHLRNDESPLD